MNQWRRTCLSCESMVVNSTYILEQAYFVLVTNNGSPYQYCLHSWVEWTLPIVHKGLESKGLILLQQRKGSLMSYVGKKFHQWVHLPLTIKEYGKQKEKKKAMKNHHACQRPMQNNPNKITHYFPWGPF